MPRPNPPRDVYAERHLAQRIARERKNRGWTYEGLAQRMTDAGCPINQSAIYKTEREDRRITVDELVAYSRVLGVPVDELLLDPEITAEREMIDLLNEWRSIMAERAEAVRALDDRSEAVEQRIRELALSSDPASKALHARLAEQWPPERSTWAQRMYGYFTEED